MALNIAFSGYVYRADDTIGNDDIWYRVYFYKVNVSSSTSQWDTYETEEGNIRKCENTGYWAFNLGDAGLLSQSGSASASDRVIVTFFMDENDSNNDDKDSCTLTEVGAYEFTLTSAENYSKDMQTVSVDEVVNSQCKPDISNWSLNSQNPSGTSNGVVFTNYSYSSASCSYVRQISYSTTNGATMYHWWSRVGTTVNDGFRITTREYDFHEGSGWQTLTSSGNVQWSNAGIYKCLLRLTTCFGNSDASIRDTDDIEMIIRWRSPVPNINCLEDNASNHVLIPDTTVSFQYNGTDPDNRISVIDWTINDPGNNTVTTDQIETSTVPHTNGPGTSWFGHTASSGAFGTSGSHNVDIIIHWDNGIDGTSTPVINYTEAFIQDLFSGPSLNFIQTPPQANVGSNVDFTNTSTNITRVGTAGTGEEYDWRYNDNGLLTNVFDEAYTYVFGHTPLTGNGEVILYAHWNDGFSDQVSSISKNVIFGTSVEINDNIIPDATCIFVFSIKGTSTGGGSPTGYRWRVFYDPTGVNELVWTSPTNLSQQNKRFYFAKVGWYRVEGSIYGAGSPTTDFEDIYIDALCICGECPECPDAEVIGGGGGAGWSRREDEEFKRPSVIVKKVEYENEEGMIRIEKRIDAKLKNQEIIEIKPRISEVKLVED